MLVCRSLENLLRKENVEERLLGSAGSTLCTLPSVHVKGTVSDRRKAAVSSPGDISIAGPGLGNWSIVMLCGRLLISPSVVRRACLNVSESELSLFTTVGDDAFVHSRGLEAYDISFTVWSVRLRCCTGPRCIRTVGSTSRERSIVNAMTRAGSRKVSKE